VSCCGCLNFSFLEKIQVFNLLDEFNQARLFDDGRSVHLMKWNGDDHQLGGQNAQHETDEKSPESAKHESSLKHFHNFTSIRHHWRKDETTNYYGGIFSRQLPESST
jgi:hypothetical protein